MNQDLVSKKQCIRARLRQDWQAVTERIRPDATQTTGEETVSKMAKQNLARSHRGTHSLAKIRNPGGDLL